MKTNASPPKSQLHSGAPAPGTATVTLETARTRPMPQRITVVPQSVLFFENPTIERLFGRQSQGFAPMPQGKLPLPALSKGPPAMGASEPAARRSEGSGTKRPRASGQSGQTAEPGTGASERRNNLRAKTSSGHSSENADGKDDGRTLYENLYKLGHSGLSREERNEVFDQIRKQVACGVRIPKENTNDERMTKWLLLAVRHFKVEIVRVLWRAGVGSGTPHSQGLHRDRALSTLFEKSGNETHQREMAQALIELGCAVNVPDHKGIYPIHYAAAAGCQAMVNFMLRQGANPTVLDSQGRGPLFYAKNAATVYVLLAWGANAEAIDHERDTALEHAKKEGYPQDCLHALTQKDHLGMDSTELTWAGEINEEGGAFQLLNFRYGSRERDALGETPLMWSAMRNDAVTADYLICEGADIHAVRADGSTALMLASGAGHAALIRMLIGEGADVNAKSKSGFTALMYASQGGHVEATAALLAAGANMHEKNDNGQTARDLATVKGALKERVTAQSNVEMDALPMRGAEGAQ